MSAPTAGGPPAKKQCFTVIGLLDECGRLTVAGVVAGVVTTVDSDSGPGDAQRWAQCVMAADPDDAETQAHALLDGDDDL